MTNDQTPMTSERMLERLVALAREKRGEDLVALDVRELVEYMDALLVVTARSERQNRAIAENIIRGMKPEGLLPLSRAGIDGGTWICIDFVDVVVHLFTPVTRKIYDLELLWADAPRLALPEPERVAE
jgi:ribosome-associated protein